jgi:ribosomal-protein-alanine N-acetyltransferase
MNRQAFPELATERLELCEITRDHAEWYLEHFSIPEIVAGQGFPPPRDLKAAKEELDLYIVDLFEKGLGYRWGIRLKGQKDIIGSLGYYSWDRDNCKAKMGYDLRPAHWGKGIMREALERVIKFGFEDMGLNRAEVTIMATNPRSVSLVARLGFVREGVLREFSKADGKYVDEHVFSLIKKDWLAARDKPGRV